MPAAVYSFGAYLVDGTARSLTRAGNRIAVTERQLDVLMHLIEHAGDVVSKDALIEAVWRDVAVTDNSLEQVISTLRRTLGEAPGGEPFIQTVPRRGYRFAAPVTRMVSRESDARLDALLEPHRAWLEGQAALETLSKDRVAGAQEAFHRALQAAPDFAPPHIGLATAHVFRFECTRSEAVPDTSSLSAAVHHAREACRLAPDLAEAWATLGFVLNRAGVHADALAAARRAVSLEPDNWRHQLRLAFVGWGEERLRAASRALHLLPGLGLAHFLAATVHVARQSFAAAERELDAGAAAQDENRTGGSRFNAVGLHWLRGLVRLRAGDQAGARRDLNEELSFERAGHLYTAECSASVHYAFGALELQQGHTSDAVAAFERALACASGHLMAFAAKAALARDAEAVRLQGDLQARVSALETQGFGTDAALAMRVGLVLEGDHPAVAEAVQRSLSHARPGSSGWLIPVDPLLRVWEHPDAWAPVLASLRSRAA